MRGYQPYRPLVPGLRRSVRGTTRHTVKSMFPGYVFVRDVMGRGWETLREIGAIHSRWIFNGRFATLTNDEIEAIRYTEKTLMHQKAALRERYGFKPGDVLPVQSGPFLGHLATIAGLDDKGRIDVLIDLLGRKTRITLPPEHLLIA